MNSLGTMVLFKDVRAQPLGCHIDATVCSGTSCLVRPSGPMVIGKLVLPPLVAVITALVMFSMGCTVELHKLLGHLRRPWGIIIGFLCQFGIMPLTGFILSLAFNVTPLYAVVVIIVGCCPGGSGSNIVSYFLDGDMDLSISMTTCSTVMALGMMPLCLGIYTSLWVSSDTIQIPYGRIGFTLVTLLAPIAIGMLVKRKWPQKALMIVKIGSTTGVFLLVLIAVAGGVIYRSSWDLDPEIWIIGAIFPFVGSGLGFLMALFLRQPWYRCRTIALETGMQNLALCNTIVQLSFTPAEVDLMFSFPIIYGIFQITVVVLTIGGKFRVLKPVPESDAVVAGFCSNQAGAHQTPPSSSSYQIYKRKCGGGESEDSKASSLEDGEAEARKQKTLALENDGFELSENSEVKRNDIDTDTQF